MAVGVANVDAPWSSLPQWNHWFVSCHDHGYLHLRYYAVRRKWFGICGVVEDAGVPGLYGYEADSPVGTSLNGL